MQDLGKNYEKGMLSSSIIDAIVLVLLRRHDVRLGGLRPNLSDEGTSSIRNLPQPEQRRSLKEGSVISLIEDRVKKLQLQIRPLVSDIV
jgi:hypothetical protein